MKVAVVNLSALADVGTEPDFADGLALLRSHAIEPVDCASGRTTPDAMVDGLHAALDDADVGVVLTYSGGTALIECLDLIDWERLGPHSPLLVGLSDFTHLAWKAIASGCRCAYGVTLRAAVRFWQTTEKTNTVIRLMHGAIDPITPKRLWGADTIADWPSQRICGGHTFASMAVIDEAALNLRDRVLFVEHHGTPADGLGEARYWASVLARRLVALPPRAIILGHSMVFDAGRMVAADRVNDVFCERLAAIGRPIYYVDHFESLIPLH